MIHLNPEQEKVRNGVTHAYKFVFFLLSQLPMGLLAGLRVRHLDPAMCATSVPFKWLNKNPFKSTYFAVLSMAAELSTASPCVLAITGHKPSVAFIIVDLKATFLKKATDRVFFTCEDGLVAFEAVKKSITSGEAQQATLKTTGKMADGTIVAKFEFTWSFKRRSS